MSKQPICFYSNRVEILYEFLKDALFGKTTDPFTQRVVVVPSQAMKRWLMLKFAEDDKIGISAGIEFPFLERALLLLAENHLGMLHSIIPDLKDLSFRIELEIKHLIGEFPHLSTQKQKLLDPLLNYLNGSSRGPADLKQEQIRLVGLCKRLASLFISYGQYGGEMLEKWGEDLDLQNATDWQQLVWNGIYGTNGHWTYWHRLINDAIKLPIKEENIQIHLFGLSFLSKRQCKFFMHLAKGAEVYFHILSPCKAFWTDICSSYEGRRLQHYWEKKGASVQERNALEDFLLDTNTLLANWGILGRKYTSFLEEDHIVTFEKYAAPASISSTYPYRDEIDEELLIEPKEGRHSLLEAVQADILLLRNPEHTEPIALFEEDDSIQVHSSTTKLREVQSLHDAVMRIIANHRASQTPICPNDIVVMAPRIADYVPYIKAVFETQEGLLPIQFSDLVLSGQNLFVKGFRQLIDLSQGRWKVSDLLCLFENRAFLRKNELSDDDVEKFRTWIRTVSIRWGQDKEHRFEKLSEEYFGMPLQGQNSQSTWEQGFERMLQRLTRSFENDTIGSGLDISTSDLLGKLWRLTRALADDLKPLSDGALLDISSWAVYLECIVNSYLSPDPTVDGDEKDYAMLIEQISQFQRTAQHLSIAGENYQFSFESLLPHLTEILGKESMDYNERHLQAIRFSSLLPMRAIPARIVCLMGLDEPNYPRREINSSFNLLKSESTADYCPSQGDYDRYLFLESLLSARDYFLISYQGRASSDGKPQQPSVIVSELMDYLDKNYTLGTHRFSEKNCWSHPHQSYHLSYFQSDRCSFSQSRYREACARYGVEAIPPHRFFPDFYVHSQKSTLRPICPQGEIIIDLKHLRQSVKTPMQVYLNQSLGMYVKSDEEEDLDQEPFVFSKLDQWRYKNAFLNGSLEKLLQADEYNGRLPHGLWKEVATRTITEDIDELQSHFKTMGILKEEIFTIEFSEKCRCPANRGNQWILPSPKVSFGEAEICFVGKLTELAPKGLLALANNKLHEASKYLPAHILLQLVPEDFHQLEERKLLLCKSAKEIAACTDVKESIDALLHYYFTCSANPLMMLPEWIESVIEGDSETLDKEIAKSLSSRYGTFDSYTRWVLKPEDLPSAELIIEQLQDIVAALFSELKGALSPNKSGGGSDEIV